MKFTALLVLSLSLALSFSSAHAQSDKPNTELTPSEVVAIVIEALRSNDISKNDNGITTVFEFASPTNKQVTGPLSRFKKMIKGGFSDMLNHVESDFGEIDIQGDTALQAVWLTSSTGQESGYVFQIGKQSDGKYKGMWMTESVWPIGVRDSKGQSI